jgi:quinol-cytochrome oxidoreductase complex cytochrome b subunit
MSEANPHPGGTAARVFGVILMIIGFLLLAGAGLCTIIFGGVLMSEGGSVEDIGLILTYSGVPLILGGVLAWAGYAVWRSGKTPPPPESKA